MLNWLYELYVVIGFYLIALYCILVEFYQDRIRRYDGMPRLKYLYKIMKESKFVRRSGRKLVAVITGADGTIGIEIIRMLLQNDFEVIQLLGSHLNHVSPFVLGTVLFALHALFFNWMVVMDRLFKVDLFALGLNPTILGHKNQVFIYKAFSNSPKVLKIMYW